AEKRGGKDSVASAARSSIGDSCQAACVLAGRARTRHPPIVARDLALEIQLASDPPGGRMDPQRRFEQGLHQARPVVAPLHVAELMQHYLVELLIRDGFQEQGGKRDVRIMKTEHGGAWQLVADHQLNLGPTSAYFLPNRQDRK